MSHAVLAAALLGFALRADSQSPEGRCVGRMAISQRFDECSDERFDDRSDERFARSNDARVRVECAGELLADLELDARETRNGRAQLCRAERREDFGLRPVEILAGKVGLLDVRRVVRAGFSSDALVAALAFVARTDAPILDLRERGGESPTFEQFLVSCLLDGPTQRISELRRPPTADVAPLWTCPWLGVPRFFDRDVLVLTAKRTFSAAEAPAFDLRSLRRATLVGESTGGGAHAGRWCPSSSPLGVFAATARWTNSVVDPRGRRQQSGANP